MSRSYSKGFQCAGDKDFKKIYNRKFRRTFDPYEDELPQDGDYRKLNEPWNIADYRGGYNNFDSWPWIEELDEEEKKAAWNKMRSK